MKLTSAFELNGKVAVVTGGGGILCSGMSKALAEFGAKVAVLDLIPEAAQKVADEIKAAGGEAIGVAVDVLDKTSLEAAAEKIIAAYGKVDILVNGAGGNKAAASTSPGERTFFDIPSDALQWVFNLNFLGTVLTSQVFGKIMTGRGEGVIINISSMASSRPMTRVLAYAAAKAGISNFTMWLAVYMAQEYSHKIRVNAIAPGFFLTEQNRYLLTDKDTGEMTQRGRQIIDHTPMGRYGVPDDLLGTLIWLVSDAAEFVTGIIVPVDGGFSAYAGV